MDITTFAIAFLSTSLALSWYRNHLDRKSADKAMGEFVHNEMERAHTLASHCQNTVMAVEQHFVSKQHASEAIKVEQAAWCARNTGNWWFTENGYEFATVDDELLFKLKWEGAK